MCLQILKINLKKAAIAELLDFRKSAKPTFEVKNFERYLAEIQHGDLSRLSQFKSAIEWSTSKGLLETIPNLEMDVNWNDAKVEKVVFMLLKISVKLLKRN